MEYLWYVDVNWSFARLRRIPDDTTGIRQCGKDNYERFGTSDDLWSYLWKIRRESYRNTTKRRKRWSGMEKKRLTIQDGNVIKVGNKEYPLFTVSVNPVWSKCITEKILFIDRITKTCSVCYWQRVEKDDTRGEEKSNDNAEETECIEYWVFPHQITSFGRSWMILHGQWRQTDLCKVFRWIL